MKGAYLLFAPLASALDFTGQPPCAVPCLQSAIAEVHCGDLQCICPKSTQQAIREAASKCVLEKCSAIDASQAQKAAAAACSAFTSISGAVKTYSATTVRSAMATSATGAASEFQSPAGLAAAIFIALAI